MEKIDIYMTGTGWITPKGKMIGCKQYDHLNGALGHPETKNIPEIISGILRVQEVEEECEELAASGEHPEWHNYEIKEMLFKSDARDCLLRLGFIRIGYWHRRSIEAEGTPEALKKNMHLIRRITREMSINIECELGTQTHPVK